MLRQTSPINADSAVLSASAAASQYGDTSAMRSKRCASQCANEPSAYSSVTRRAMPG
jgi:hypothetical protein